MVWVPRSSSRPISAARSPGVVGFGEPGGGAGARCRQFRCGKPGVEDRSVGGQRRQPDSSSSSHGGQVTCPGEQTQNRIPKRSTVRFCVCSAKRVTHYPWGRAGLARGPDRADRGAGRHPQRIAKGGAPRRRGGGRAARPDVGLRDRPQRQRGAGAHGAGPAVAGAAGRTPGHRPGGGQPAQPLGGRRTVRLRHLGHEVRRRGLPASGGHRGRTGARPDAGVLRLRGNRGRRKRFGPHRARAARLAVRRRGHPGRAHRRLHRGRLPGHAARGDRRHRHPGPFCAILAGRQRDSQAESRAGPAGGVSGARCRDRRVRLSRGLVGRADRRRRGRQRHPGRGLGDGQLPLRPRPVGGGGAGARARGVRRARRAHRTDRRSTGRAARAGPARRQGPGGGRRRAGAGQVRLDRRRAVRRPGHPGAQLRARRPEPGAPPRGTG